MGQQDHEETQTHTQNLDSGLDSGLDPGPDLVYLHLTGPVSCPPDMEEEEREEERGEEREEQREEREAEREEEKVEERGERGEEREEEREEERVEERGEEREEEREEREELRPDPRPNPVKSVHQPLCRTQCVDLGPEGPPELHQDSNRNPESAPHSPVQSPAAAPDLTESDLITESDLTTGGSREPDLTTGGSREPDLTTGGSRESDLTTGGSRESDLTTGGSRESDLTTGGSTEPDLTTGGSREHQAKLDFALKLGYPEDTVRAVLTKLGPQTLINDVLGELVRLGTKPEPDQDSGSGPGSGPGSGQGSGPGSLCGCTDESRADSPELCENERDNLRPIVIDGSNVAMSHGNKEVFSCQGIRLTVDWFLERGHRDVTVFVPAWRKEQSRPDAPITDQETLRVLEKQKVLVFTPSRRVQGRRVVCYDDRFIVKLAFESDGIIVSNDNYRDLSNERPEWKRFIDQRLLMYSFVNDKFMPPDDPLGRHGPSLENFLRKKPVVPEQKKQPCPYGKKCTYGHKCKYSHPERGAQPQRSVADELRASAKNPSKSQTKTQTRIQTRTQSRIQTDPGLVKSHSVPTAEVQRSGPKRQSDPSIRALSYGDAESYTDDRLFQSDSRTMSPAPGGPPTSVTPAQNEALRPGPPLDLLPSDPPLYPLCPSPDYYSVSQSFSGLSCSSSRPNPDYRPDPRPNPDYRPDPRPNLDYRPDPRPNLDYRAPLDLRPVQEQDYRAPLDLRPVLDQDYRLGSLGSMGSAGSECGSESSSCDSCPTESFDDSHYVPSRLCPHSLDYCGHPHPGECPHAYPPHPDLHPPHPDLPKRPLYPLPPHLHHLPLSARSSCPGDYHQHYHHHSSPSLPPSFSDPHLYPHPRPKTLPHWDTCYRPPLAASRYDSCYWDAYGPHLQAPGHAPALSCPDRSSAPGRPARPAPTLYPPPDGYGVGYREARDKAYVNLCNIFPSELVRRVMSRFPHVTDPQTLAAEILAEKNHGGF